MHRECCRRDHISTCTCHFCCLCLRLTSARKHKTGLLTSPYRRTVISPWRRSGADVRTSPMRVFQTQRASSSDGIDGACAQRVCGLAMGGSCRF